MKTTANFLAAALVAAGTASLTACGGGGGGGFNVPANVPIPSRSVRPMNEDNEIVPVSVEVMEGSERDPLTGRVDGDSCSDARLECFPRIRTMAGDTEWFDSDSAFVIGAPGHWSANVESGRATYNGSLRVNNGEYNSGATVTVDFNNETYDLAGRSLGAEVSEESNDDGPFQLSVDDGTEIRLTGARLVGREGQYPEDINGIDKSSIDHQRVEGRRERIDSEALTAAMEALMANPATTAGRHNVTPVEGRDYGPMVSAVLGEDGGWSLSDNVLEFRRGDDDLLTTSILAHEESWVEPSAATLSVGGQSESVRVRSGNLFTDNGERFLSSVAIEDGNGAVAINNGVAILKFHTD